MGPYKSFQSKTLGNKVLSLTLPPAPHYSVASRLVASLSPGGFYQPFAVWEFQIAPSQTPGQLLVYPMSFGQRFLVLDHWDSMPVGHVHQLALPPAGTRALDLKLHRSGAAGYSSAFYRLQWTSEHERKQKLDQWRRHAVPPIDWFYVELTSQCNLSCSFCPSKHLKRPRTFMSVDDAQTIFSKISQYLRRRDASWGYTLINQMVFLHVMGEPLLHPHLVECVKAAQDAGLKPALFTNATLLTKANIQKIFTADLSHVTISLNVIDQGGYKALGAKDDLSKQHQRVVHLLRERARRGAYHLHVDIQYIVSDGRTVSGTGLVNSRQEAWSCYRNWIGLIQQIEPSEIQPVGHQPVVQLDLLANPLTQDGGDPSLRLPLAVGIDLVMKGGCSFGNSVVPPGMQLVTTHWGRCPFDSPQRQMAIFVDGSVSFCNLDYENSVKLGSLLEQSVEEVWDSPRMQQIRRDMASGILTEPLCRQCLGTLKPST